MGLHVPQHGLEHQVLISLKALEAKNRQAIVGFLFLRKIGCLFRIKTAR